eukprot:g2285.t1
MNPKTKALVTGGSGFVGRRLVKELVTSEKYSVTVFDLSPPPSTDPHPEGVIFIKGDLTDAEQVKKAFEGIRVVFHVATATPTSENTISEDLMTKVNVKGTANVIAACMHQGVEKLIYTSTASVAFDGSDILYKDEQQLGYAHTPVDAYTGTKIIGEKLVLEANGKGNKLATCALRPSAIFGEGDVLLVPTFVKRAKQGKMKYIIGNGENVMDFTYVGNVVYAHLLAAEKLSLDSPVAGQAYFITNQEPIRFWEFTGDLLEGLGYERPYIKLPFLLMFIVFWIFQFILMPIIGCFKKLSSDLTVNRIRLVSKHRHFNTSKAKNDLGYTAKVSMEEAKERTLKAFSHLKKSAS